MRFIETKIPGLIIVEPTVHRDARGFFMETFHAEKYAEAGIEKTFVQDNHSKSTRGTLRGLHAQARRPQAKLVRVMAGEVYDVAVDARRGSPTFGKWTAARLSDRNFYQVYIPVGFFHGFCVTSAEAHFEYKCADFYDPDDEIAVRWDDPDIGVQWPVEDPIVSEKDQKAPHWAEVVDKLPSDGGWRYEG